MSQEGATTRAGRDANERFYGCPHRSAAIVLEGKAGEPHDAGIVSRFQETLARHTPEP